MLVYRIAKTLNRTKDLSGTGAFKYGGRWNSKGTCVLYTSMNSSLAYLENLVHFSDPNIPPDLFITAIEINAEHLIYHLPDNEYPAEWELPENYENKLIGDKWMAGKMFAVKVRSVINPSEFNYLLNPLFPGYHDLVKIQSIEKLRIDSRLIK